MLPSKIGLMAGLNRMVRISASVDNYNLRTALGNPTGPVKVVVIIDSGVTIGSADEANPAFTTGSGWTAGSRVRIVNAGKIYGRAGDGGKGGYISYDGLTQVNGVAGNAGGDAIYTTIPITIDNTSGEIFGGGGGGGGGAGIWNFDGFGNSWGAAGSGAGGGQGFGTSSAGAGGNGDTFVTAGNAGTAGNSSAAGSGGAEVAAPVQPTTDKGGVGGAGGAWGAAGTTGTYGSVAGMGGGTPHDIGLGTLPGAGGAGGYAVRLNGQSITWVAGNNGAQVKGSAA